MAVLTFLALGEGTSPLALGPVVLSDALGDPLLATIADSTLTVHAVPEPAAGWLLASALALALRRAGRAAPASSTAR